MPTQVEVGAHLGISVTSVKEYLSRWGLKASESTLDDLRRRYIEHLRGVAAQHESSSGESLNDVRIERERTEGELKKIELARELGLLAPIDELISGMAKLGGGIRDDVMTSASRIIEGIESRYDIELDGDLVNEPLRNALIGIASRVEQHSEDMGGSS